MRNAPWLRPVHVHGHTADLMVRCVWAFALVVVLVGTPVAVTVCQVTCGSHAGHAEAGAHHHSCAFAQAAASAVNGAPHTCDHPSRATVGIQQGLHVLTAPALGPVQAFSLPHTGGVFVAARALDLEHSPPGALALITRLRV